MNLKLDELAVFRECFKSVSSLLVDELVLFLPLIVRIDTVRNREEKEIPEERNCSLRLANHELDKSSNSTHY